MRRELSAFLAGAAISAILLGVGVIHRDVVDHSLALHEAATPTTDDDVASPSVGTVAPPPSAAPTASDTQARIAPSPSSEDLIPSPAPSNDNISAAPLPTP